MKTTPGLAAVFLIKAMNAAGIKTKTKAIIIALALSGLIPFLKFAKQKHGI